MVVATSNVEPDGLYAGGLNRQNVLPFIDHIKRRMKVIQLAAAKDFRLAKLLQEARKAQPSLTLRAGFVSVGEARSDWVPDPAHPLPTFNPPRRVPHGVTLVGRLFDEGKVAQLLIAAGTEGVKVNTPIAVILADGEASGAMPQASASTLSRLTRSKSIHS